jgi:hypothetical protein
MRGMLSSRTVAAALVTSFVMTAGLVLAAGTSGPAVAAVTGPASGASVASRASAASGALAAAAARTPAAQAAVAAASLQRMYNSGDGLFWTYNQGVILGGLRREHRVRQSPGGRASDGSP